MELRALGSGGVRVSVLGLGTVKLGRTAGLKYPGEVRLPTDEEARGLLRAAGECGVNYIDTAPAYGSAEERLGVLLAGERDRWVISTKAGEEFDGEKSAFDFSPEAITRSVERSLGRLRTDRVELVLLHSDGVAETRFDALGSFDALRRLKARGLVRAFGASTKTAAGAMLAVRACDAVMVTLNEEDRASEPAIAEADRRGVGVLIKKALRSGHAAAVGGGAVVGGVVGGGADPVEAALRFVLGHRGVTSVVVGTTSAENLRRNAECVARLLG